MTSLELNHEDHEGHEEPSGIRFVVFVCSWLAAGLSCCPAIAGSVAVSAQWPAFAPPDVPRGADGQPNLDAPAPRLPNGKPDFSGVWESRVGPSGRLGGPFLPSLTADSPPVATFVDVGRNVKEGLPLTPAAAELKKQRMSRNSMDNPDAHCLPLGFMQLHTHSQPRKIVHTKDTVVIGYEANYGLRWIFTDGRALPTNDPQPFWYGYSVGRWNGDELVVETIGLRDDGWLDVNGTPFGSTTKVTERFRRVNYGRLRSTSPSRTRSSTRSPSPRA